MDCFDRKKNLPEIIDLLSPTDKKIKLFLCISKLTKLDRMLASLYIYANDFLAIDRSAATCLSILTGYL